MCNRSMPTSPEQIENGPPCPKCGGATIIRPGTPPHYARLDCTECRAWRWLPNPDPRWRGLLQIRNTYPMGCRVCERLRPANSGRLYKKEAGEQWTIFCDECQLRVKGRH